MSLLVVFSVNGCGGSKYPPTFKTTGTVTLDGKPIEGATVSFYPDGTNKPANGETDASGQYQMSSFNKNDGATVGSFRVTVQKQPKRPVQIGFVWDGHGEKFVMEKSLSQCSP